MEHCRRGLSQTCLPLFVQKVREEQRGIPGPKVVITSLVSGVGLAELLQEVDIRVSLFLGTASWA
jgi:hypothetical protein